MFLSLLVLAITLSLDFFGIGIAYGIRKISVDLKSKIVLFFVCFVLALISMLAGHFFLGMLPGWLPEIFGCLILICMGIWIIIQSFKPITESANILNNPASSDIDCSKTIDIKEAVKLGLAMFGDVLVCGFGYSTMAELSCLFSLFVAFFHILFLTIGIHLGSKINSASKLSPTILSRISGILLILFGITKLV